MLWADEGDGRLGEVSFRQISPVNPILVNINVTGIPRGKHAVHIHAYGDMRERCRSTGPHVRGILVCPMSIAIFKCNHQETMVANGHCRFAV